MLNQRQSDSPHLQRQRQWFPAYSESGHVAEMAQHELDGLTVRALLFTYPTLALQAGVAIAELKFLLNHAVGDVTMWGT